MNRFCLGVLIVVTFHKRADFFKFFVLFLSIRVPGTGYVFPGGDTPLYKLYRYVRCAGPKKKGMVFEPFWSEIG